MTCCFTGHRPNKLNGYKAEDNKELLWRLRGEIVRHIEEHKVDTFITGMALGIDMWAARIVIRLKETYPHLKLVAAIPCAGQSSKWPEKSRIEWNQICEACDVVHYVSTEPYTNYCMQKRNEYMSDNSQFVIAVWDGSNGGTGNCVKYARTKDDKKITVITP